ncbi:Nop14-like protein [Cylindrobasidium torrendii FP15055 ss-10]|uniref:Nop14-like protein n=1 Tax=Cylindrobasidium torrendii FP15055 ss-10 TaxID=1314674 RepID=A0A0D7B846_9AGAR|nr:Nop14-like protein [Cylindrobasidium torrendii FP15055 ss-10]
MGKGSQLSQLKSALHTAGITGKPQGTKRKRSNSVSGNDKEKRDNKLAAIQSKLNPFDTKVTKLKHDVGGRKLKGVVGKPAQSKSAGMEKRKQELLKEYQEKDRAGGIVDRRFGENDPSMSIEDRMLERFTRERQRAAKSGAFNLEDEDDLTHYGQSLSKMDDFDDAGLGFDDSDEEDERQGQIDRAIVSNAHFGGFDNDEEQAGADGEPAPKKSKAEVMAEVMAKSKEHKVLRQMEKEKGEEVRAELDDAFASLRSLLYAPVATSAPAASDAAPETSEAAPADPTASVLLPKDFTYDLHVKELAFEQRAKPKDRTKTEEELALEEKEALEKAERKRKKRMAGLEDSDAEDDDKPRKRRRGDADDLDDDFMEEDEAWTGIGKGLGEEEDEQASDEEDEDEDEDEDEGDSDDSGAEVREDEDASDAEGLTTSAPPSSKSSKRKAAAKELPFTFECPASHAQFLELIQDIDDNDVPTVVQRIRTLHHPSFAPENKFKLQVFSGVLIDHILYLCSPSEPRVSHIPSFLSHLLALVKAYPVQAAEHFVKKLTLMHKNLNRGLSRGALNPEAKTWPGMAELTILRIIGKAWSTSDLNHAVVSPARVLMGSYLGLGRVRSASDIASGLFICTLLLQYEKLSKRLIPEAINFLVNAVLHLAPSSYEDASALPGSFACPDFKSGPALSLLADASVAPPERLDILSVLSSAEPSSEACSGLLKITFDLLGRYAEMYKSLDGFIELFTPISDVLKNVSKQKKLHDTLQAQLSALRDSLKRLLKFANQSRRPLALQAHKPIPIATYIPKFDGSSSSYIRKQDPDHERNEAAKLRNQVKQERKGAIRELRKDSRFLANVQQEQQREKDKSYRDSLRKVYGSIEGERAEEKAMEKEKARDKKRAGKK